MRRPEDTRVSKIQLCIYNPKKCATSDCFSAIYEVHQTTSRWC